MFEQNPTEWSEKDKTIIESACYALELHGHTKLAEMLKSLRPQPKQEWSEEDEERLMELISLLKDAEDYLKEHGNMFSYNPMLLIKWLKSLRPSWKLCKEQSEVDLEKFTEKIDSFKERYKNNPERASIKGAMAFMARMFYQYPSVAREWYENLPKATMD